eukprot:GDKK01045075.1.p1 GENE.GDKK01045075.1~~GDKK01045075.1.p1  ORF type:complete len:111 (-),score=9.38 GDKK01045075.1:262-594(-)
MHIRSLLISAAVACTFALETKETHTISAHTFAETEAKTKADTCSTQSQGTNEDNRAYAQEICGHKCDVKIASYGHAHNLHKFVPDYMICDGTCEKYSKSYQGRKQLNVGC